MSLINICIHLVTADLTSTSVPDNVQSQPTLERWEDRHVRLLIESYLKLKDLIGQGNNTKKGLFDKIAVAFNKRETLCAREVERDRSDPSRSIRPQEISNLSPEILVEWIAPVNFSS